MLITRFETEDDHAPGAVGLALFNVQIGEVLLRNVMLRSNDEGGYKIVPPSAFGQKTFSVRPRLWAAIEREAIALYEAGPRS